MRARWILPLAVLLTILSLGATLFAQAPASYVIIVNSSNPLDEVDRRFLADAFLKKVTTWPRGEAIRPVDLPSTSAVRRKFTEDVLKRSVDAVKSYWQQHIFAGRDLPPPEVDSEEDVVSYVLKHPGAAGYVSTGAELRGAKVVALR